MSAKVSSSCARVSWRWPTTSWSGASTNRWVASASGSSGSTGLAAAALSAGRCTFLNSDSKGVHALAATSRAGNSSSKRRGTVRVITRHYPRRRPGSPDLHALRGRPPELVAFLDPERGIELVHVRDHAVGAEFG